MSYYEFSKSIKSASGNIKPFELNALFDHFKIIDN